MLCEEGATGVRETGWRPLQSSVAGAGAWTQWWPWGWKDADRLRS